VLLDRATSTPNSGSASPCITKDSKKRAFFDSSPTSAPRPAPDSHLSVNDVPQLGIERSSSHEPSPERFLSSGPARDDAPPAPLYRRALSVDCDGELSSLIALLVPSAKEATMCDTCDRIFDHVSRVSIPNARQKSQALAALQRISNPSSPQLCIKAAKCILKVFLCIL
jgi:hypothetical protein